MHLNYFFTRGLGIFVIIGLIAWTSFAHSDTSVPANQIFSCGADFTQVELRISTHGNVNAFSSPGPAMPNHINGSLAGYQVCYATGSSGPFFTAFDGGGAEAGWAAGVSVSQPNGPGTFPLEIARDTADGRVRITRRFTGNSFVAPVPPGNALDLNGNGQACDTLEECGNCTNRTLHVLTRVTNLTGGNLFNIAVVEKADFNIGGVTGNRFGRSTDSVVAYADLSEDPSHAYAMLLQTLILPATSGVLNAGSYGFPSSCAVTSVTTPTATGNFEGILGQSFGTLSPGANTGNSFRVHYRRF
jgi:hypothetical protein